MSVGELSRAPRPLDFIAPRYWPIWCLAGLMRCAAKLPYRAQLCLGAWLGNALFVLAGRRRRIAAVNIALCFPEMGAAERRHLLEAHFRCLGTAVMELALTYWASDAQLRPLVKLTGMEHLEAGLGAGKGVILLGIHFTNMELGLRLLSLHQSCEMMYRKHNNPLMEYILHSGRDRHPGHIFPREDVRTLYRSLKENRVVWYAPDQNYGRRYSVFAPFFGHLAATITTTARFARKSGAAVIPFAQYRLPGTEGYELVIGAPLEGFPSGDEVADAKRVNEVIEAQILRRPEQYLWVHRRFKTRPPGDAHDVYASL